MTTAVVSGCVQSILASFTSAIDVFKKTSKKRSKTRRTKIKRPERIDDGEARLLSSLEQGPTSINHEYQRSLQAIGGRFAAGDAIAQVTLAEILLRVNASLVAIIKQFLRREEVVFDLDSLTNSSERAREDTCSALRKLHQRLLRMSPLQGLSNADHRRKNRSNSVHGKHRKVRRPMLAKVYIADSSKSAQIAIVKPGARQTQNKQRTSSGMSSNVHHSKSTLVLPSSLPVILEPDDRRPRASYEPPVPQRITPTIDAGQFEPKVLRVARSTPRLQQNGAQERGLLRDTPSTPSLNTRSRKPTPTFHSIESNSTKLGEIPLHKWHEPPDFEAMSLLNEAAKRNGWPINENHFEQFEKKKKKFGFFGLFRGKKPS